MESVAYSPRKDLLQIKGISEAKVDKIVEAGMSFFVSVSVIFSPYELGSSKYLKQNVFLDVNSFQIGPNGFHKR